MKIINFLSIDGYDVSQACGDAEQASAGQAGVDLLALAGLRIGQIKGALGGAETYLGYGSSAYSGLANHSLLSAIPGVATIQKDVAEFHACMN